MNAINNKKREQKSNPDSLIQKGIENFKKIVSYLRTATKGQFSATKKQAKKA